ncbi:DNA-directed RNA polymerase [Cantharellus anzutake]|uniref:DNA-directed RNA polymerase n=1 Tax=Cantharellus anzutake TaxID=1750568 RepID=UPI001908330F|nr:DNA-directed RNA polymerase [Cantharellus anzutake]KAF8332782.1 DNA-directed RNA polymerase [Cantharellus anzutake]
MNAPNRFELYTLGDGEKFKIRDSGDTKIPNAATFRINKQDHTMANMIRSQLLRGASVLFAGYKVPHPLEPYFILKVQTDGSISPSQALQEACQQVIALIADLQQKFNKEFEMKEIDEVGAPPGVGVGLGAYGETLGSRGVGDYLDFGGS